MFDQVELSSMDYMNGIPTIQSNLNEEYVGQ